MAQQQLNVLGEGGAPQSDGQVNGFALQGSLVMTFEDAVSLGEVGKGKLQLLLAETARIRRFCNYFSRSIFRSEC